MDLPTRELNFLPIRGFGISNYRSIGEIPAKIGPLSKINLLIGRNNSGKSNLLRFAFEHLPHLLGPPPTQPPESYQGFSPADRPQRGALTRSFYLLSHPIEQGGLSDKLFKHYKFIDQRLQECTAGWIEFRLEDRGKGAVAQGLLDSLANNLNLSPHQEAAFLDDLGIRRDNLSTRLSLVLGARRNFSANVVMVPAKRSIRASSRQEPGWTSRIDGEDLISKLAVLQHPRHDPSNPSLYDKAQSRFKAICSLLQDITGDREARIEIPGDRGSITTYFDGRVLDLEDVGTGIHEAIVIAAVAAVNPGSFVCLEEPEIHLHPLLQRKLIEYLAKKTDCQYLIATHSVHFMDHPDSTIFRIELDEMKNSVATPAITSGDKFEICSHLGIRPSDLLQTNCVIWVEGPSDRIYLKYWLSSKAPDLREHIEYSIMFYGGSLLKHLSAEEPDEGLLTELILLRKLNRSLAMLMDSDRKTETEEIGEAKLRLQTELEKSPRSLVWITDGREVENYLVAEELKSAISLVHPKNTVTSPKNVDFGQVKIKGASASKEKLYDKVRVAEAYVVRNPLPNFSRLALESRIEKLAAFIRLANHSG